MSEEGRAEAGVGVASSWWNVGTFWVLPPHLTSQFGPHGLTHFFILFLKYILDFIFYLFFYYKLTPIHCGQTRKCKKVKRGRNKNQA